MSIRKCENGHFYDTDAYPACPYCAPQGGREDFNKAAKAGCSSEDFNKADATRSSLGDFSKPDEAGENPKGDTEAGRRGQTEDSPVNYPAGIYEGDAPYIFVSYSHRDMSKMAEIRAVLDRNGVRYWYDDGLHSGADWNLVIAKHLQDAAVCLLLLSPNSAESEYVKNELNFSMTRRIPIHTLLVSEFSIPIDIEMMIGRIQMVRMAGGYEAELLQALPGEVFYGQQAGHEAATGTPGQGGEHPFYTRDREYMNCQGTTTYLGFHRKLGYPVLILEEQIRSSDNREVMKLASLASRLAHPLFPKIYDVQIDGETMRTYQSFREEVLLKEYLKSHKLSEEQVISWMNHVVEGIAHLFGRNLALRDFARGSVCVLEQKAISLFRLQNRYYGLVELRPETKQFYFEAMVKEMAVLLYQLCTGETPALPFPIIRMEGRSKGFLNKVNLIIQKSTKEQGRLGYTDFSQIQEDLKAPGVSLKQLHFLRQRESKLEKYHRVKKESAMVFTGNDGAAPSSGKRVPGGFLTGEKSRQPYTGSGNLEREFGLEETVAISPTLHLEDMPGRADTPQIEVMVCSTKEMFRFPMESIIIGRGTGSDLIMRQYTMSRRHLRVQRKGDQYYIQDMQTANGSTIVSDGEEIPVSSSQMTPIAAGTVVKLGGFAFQIGVAPGQK